MNEKREQGPDQSNGQYKSHEYLQRTYGTFSRARNAFFRFILIFLLCRGGRQRRSWLLGMRLWHTDRRQPRECDLRVCVIVACNNVGGTRRTHTSTRESKKDNLRSKCLQSSMYRRPPLSSSPAGRYPAKSDRHSKQQPTSKKQLVVKASTDLQLDGEPFEPVDVLEQAVRDFELLYAATC